MKTARYLVPLLLLALAGCAAKALQDLTPQDAIIEAKLVLKGSQDVLEANLDDGVYTADEAARKLAQLEGYWKDIKEAETLLALGKGLEAKTKADLVKSLASALRRELAERARQ
jgi:electron transfer flavoprotein alpha subunit